jgi:hypothetical protein
MAMDWGIALGVAGIAVGVPALAMAIPPFFQMVRGRPNLAITVDEATSEDGKQLIVSIQNKETGGRFLKKIGVEREIGNILGFFDVQEQGTNRYIKRHVSGLLSCPPTREMGLLARAHPMFHVGMHLIHARNEKCWIIDGRSENFDEIAPGDYIAMVTIICGEQVHNMSKTFRVGKTQYETFWV